MFNIVLKLISAIWNFLSTFGPLRPIPVEIFRLSNQPTATSERTSCPINPPLPTTERSIFESNGCKVYGYPSTGGVLIKSACLLDMLYLSLSRTRGAQRSPDQDEEDKFCTLLRRTGAKWWKSRDEWVKVQLGMRDETEEEKRVVVYGWPADGVGVWVLKYERANLVPVDFGRLGFAMNMEEKIEMMKEYGAEFVEDITSLKELSDPGASRSTIRRHNGVIFLATLSQKFSRNLKFEPRYSTIWLVSYCTPSFIADLGRVEHAGVEYQELNYGDHILGIDLGERYAQVGVVRNNVFEMIPDKQGRTVIPSYVSFLDDGEPLFGFDAKAQAFVNPKNTFYDIIHWWVVIFKISSCEKQSRIYLTIIGNQDGEIRLRIHANGEDRFITPEEVLTMIFRDLVSEEHLNTTISYAVVPPPNTFFEKQVQAVKNAASQAGLEAVRTYSRSRSVGIAHRFHKSEGEKVFLAGEPSRTVEAQAVLESFFGKKASTPVAFSNVEVVVYGAATHGYDMISYDGIECYMLDSTPLDLGIKISTGDFVKVIRRNTVIPTRKRIGVTTIEDNQEDVAIRIFEGAEGKAFRDRVLGTLDLTGLPRELKGVSRIEVTLELDANGIMKATAECKGNIDTLWVDAREYTQDEIENLLA
ncbi:hypothetical protein VTL71DRAFT_1167 [Oculimacula yallundae]|uniref:Uncharacterized protein n=1 Tax=Oculimacula yallundae TaxID=86028 RepID=A0ABR4D245_9HELO